VNNCMHGQPEWAVCQDCIDNISQEQADHIKELEAKATAYQKDLEADALLVTQEIQALWSVIPPPYKEESVLVAAKYYIEKLKAQETKG
jgi:hypothetical protein